MKSYLDYKDIIKILGVSKNNAYEIIENLKVESGWGDTFEGKNIRGKIIPSKVFVKYFPSHRKNVKEIT